MANDAKLTVLEDPPERGGTTSLVLPERSSDGVMPQDRSLQRLPWKVDVSYGGRVQVLDAAGTRVAIFYGGNGMAVVRANAAVAAVNAGLPERSSSHRRHPRRAAPDRGSHRARDQRGGDLAAGF